MNKPIEELLRQYTEEACDFDDLAWVINVSARYIETMPDSQVRCLLHTLVENMREVRQNKDKWLTHHYTCHYTMGHDCSCGLTEFKRKL